MASGTGTNFQHVVDCTAAGRLDLEIVALICNRPDAGAIEKARLAGVEVGLALWNRSTQTRAEYDRRVLEMVAIADPEVILLLGWMHILAAEFFERFPNLINIHPAFLPLDPAADSVEMPDGTVIPAFRGPHALDDAILARVAWAGATCHLVTPAVDRGPVLDRAALPLLAGDTKESAFARLRPLEYQVLEGGIRRWLEERPKRPHTLHSD